MNIPSDAVGRIIGRGGAKIRELQEQTGTRISVRFQSHTFVKTVISFILEQVKRDEGGGSDVPIHISGSSEQQKHAERLIKETIDDNSSYSSQPKNPRFDSNAVTNQPDVGQIDWGAVIKESVSELGDV